MIIPVYTSIMIPVFISHSHLSTARKNQVQGAVAAISVGAEIFAGTEGCARKAHSILRVQSLGLSGLGSLGFRV